MIPAASFAQGEEESPAGQLEEIVVTGTLIARPAAEALTPLVTVDLDALQATGTANVADALNDMPLFGIADSTPISSNARTQGIGLNLLNLRNLGSSRTLVLVNGRRHVAGQAGTSAVDLNNIPVDMIERMEIITGGASALYGSEAVAGVVNIITKTDFEGLSINAQSGITGESDGFTADVSVTSGTRFADGRGSVLANFTYADNDEIKSTDRPFSDVDLFANADGSIQNPAYSSFGMNGHFTYVNNAGQSVSVTQGADGLFTKRPVTAEDGFNRDAQRLIRMPMKRYLGSLYSQYELTDSVKAFVETSYARSEMRARTEHSTFGALVTNLVLPVNNPYIPAEILSNMGAAATAAAGGVQFRKRASEFGYRDLPTTRDMFRIAAGFSGELSENWSWRQYVQYGQTKERQLTTGLVNVQKTAYALDAEVGPDGQLRCVNAAARADGCVPIDLFGANSISPAGVDYIEAVAHYDTSIKQKVASAILTGTPFSLPMGDLGVAAGIEYRDEESAFLVDELTERALLNFAQRPDVVGDYDVKEAFTEISAPLLKDLGWVDELTVDAAVRYADYSTIGSVISWKTGAGLALPGGIRFRGGYAVASRAPNITDLFLPQQRVFGRVNDPCAGGGAVAGLAPEIAQNRRANCAALGIGPSFAPDQVALESLQGTTGGNPNLQEEEAKTLTLGVALMPGVLGELTFTADYWRIEIEDSIGSISRQTTVNQCVDQPAISNPFCASVARDPLSLQLREIHTLQQNLAMQNVSGIDFEMMYPLDLGAAGGLPVRLNLSLLGAYLLKDETIQFAGATTDDFRGEVGHSKWRLNSQAALDIGDWRVAWRSRFIGASVLDIDSHTAANEIGSKWYHDLSLDYQVNDRWKLNAGIRNLADTQPPLIPSPHPRNIIGTETAADVYDVIGRYYYLGAGFSL